MARCLVVFGASLVMAVSVGGCARMGSEVAQPSEIGSLAPESVGAEPYGPATDDVVHAAREAGGQAPKPATYFHDKCEYILKNFVDDKGMVDYQGLRQKRFGLRSLLDEFKRLDPAEYKSWSGDDKTAFWINAYNLEKLKIVAENYPIKPSSRILTVYWGPFSLRHIEDKIAVHKFLVMDEQFTFARIEKRFFSEESGDPRVFFALTSASLSSPPLRNEPYYGHKLNEQLESQARRFTSSPIAFDIDREKQVVSLSAMFELSSHGKDFLKKYATGKKFKVHPPVTRAVLNFITNYISEQDVSFLGVGDYSVKYMKHDWTINDGS
ncbi:MAG: DUF547 domain-containing protein [Planctomycetota bacterium]